MWQFFQIFQLGKDEIIPAVRGTQKRFKVKNELIYKRKFNAFGECLLEASLKSLGLYLSLSFLVRLAVRVSSVTMTAN
ncbi:hypothetical protein EFY79_20015 [Hanamia caeni]|uniref:Uncharacterized protein n=1 Tax=Hanamia caeni TaxID=2294116 RepID=A0A3M9N6F7_9BACT|nr:hypothetical protein EFY79_20015 [Hanamia caeni]